MIRFRRIGDDTWQRDGWRTDLPTNLYRQWPHILAVRWQTPDGAACIIPTRELQRVFSDARPRGGDGNKFLFRIVPEQKAIRPDGSDELIQLEMEVLDGPGPMGDDPSKRRRGWGIRESEWHRGTVMSVGNDPTLIALDPSRIVRRWVNSCRSDDKEWLWHVLRTYKRPDVVFELENPAELIVTEVEPQLTLPDGIAQLVGDYRVSLEVDRRLTNDKISVVPCLVSDAALSDLAEAVRQEISARELRYFVA